MESTWLSEEEMKVLLTSDRYEDRCKGLEYLDLQYREVVAQAIRRHFPNLPLEDLADVWRQTVQESVVKVLSQTFQQSGSLLSFLCKIAICRATDGHRRAKVRKDVLQSV